MVTEISTKLFWLNLKENMIIGCPIYFSLFCIHYLKMDIFRDHHPVYKMFSTDLVSLSLFNPYSLSINILYFGRKNWNFLYQRHPLISIYLTNYSDNEHDVKREALRVQLSPSDGWGDWGVSDPVSRRDCSSRT